MGGAVQCSTFPNAFAYVHACVQWVRNGFSENRLHSMYNEVVPVHRVQSGFVVRIVAIP